MGVVVINIHGIGEQGQGYDSKFQKALQSRIAGLKFISCNWQQATQPSQLALFNHTQTLKWTFARKFMITYAADALGYQISYNGQGCYRAIHEQIDLALSIASSHLGEDDSLIIVAHSLGSVIVSNFIWDAQHLESSGNQSFQASEDARKSLKSLKSLITLGSPLAIWSLQHKDGGLPISVPRWLNVFSPYDIIGCPLRIINEEYAQCSSIVDTKMTCGNFLFRYTPMSHVTYHSDRKVLDLIVREINQADQT